MGNLLTTASVLMCPHGGSVQITSSNTKASASSPLVRSSDTFTVAGCAFNVAGGPHPCVLVQWIVPTLRGKAGGDPLLSQDSVGLCLAGDQVPQGPVQIVTTQPRVSGL